MAGLSTLARPASTNGGTLSYLASSNGDMLLSPTQPYPASTNGSMGSDWAPVPLLPMAASPSAIASGVSKLHASNNDSTHVNKRPPLQFVLKQTLFRKMFLKEAPYSKFAEY